MKGSTDPPQGREQRKTDMDPRPSLDLLESAHVFPGVYQIKAIGRVDDGFEGRVLELVRAELASVDHLEHSVRSTPDGRHVSLTMDVTVQSAEQVRTLYAKLQLLEGLRLLL